MLQWTWDCIYLFKILFSLPLDICPEVELLDHMIVLFLIFWGHSIMFVFFGHMPIQILCSFLIGLFVCFHHEFTSSLYILYINQLLDTLFANIFFHSVGNFSFCWGVPFLWKSFLVSCSPICLFCFCFPCPERLL